MHNPAWPWRTGVGLVIAVLVSAGCSSGPGRGFTLFPQGHRLIDQAKELRDAYPQPVALPRELDKRVATPYIVEPGDVLLVTPANLDSPVRLPGDQPVLPDGSIQLGRYGRLVVAGKTVEEIEASVKQLIDAQTKDAGPITVRLVTRVSKVYYVLGEVNSPGAFTLSGRETVLDAIVTAGGLTDRASRRNIILSRPTHPGSCRVVLPICYNEIVQLGDTSTNYQIAAGDRVYVPSRSFCEDMMHSKKDCPPCGQAQTPCPLPPAELHGCQGPCTPAVPDLPPPAPAAPAPPALLDAPRP